VIDALALTAIFAALALAVWAFVECARQRPPGRSLFTGLAVVGAIAMVQSIIAAVSLIAGHGPTGGERVATFVGYLLTTALLPPGGYVLAKMEPTRWGSGLIGAAAIIVPVLVLRMQQVWG
jgi:hypothetical protein